jgi:hypothetical protein
MARNVYQYKTRLFHFDQERLRGRRIPDAEMVKRRISSLGMTRMLFVYAIDSSRAWLHVEAGDEVMVYVVSDGDGTGAMNTMFDLSLTHSILSFYRTPDNDLGIYAVRPPDGQSNIDADIVEMVARKVEVG